MAQIVYTATAINELNAFDNETKQLNVTRIA